MPSNPQLTLTDILSIQFHDIFVILKFLHHLQVMIQDETYAADALVDLAPNVPTNNLDDGKGGNSGHSGGGGGGGQGAFQYPPQNPPPAYPPPQQTPFVYPPPGATAYPPPPPMNQNMNEKDLLRLNEGPPPYFPPGGMYSVGLSISRTL